MSTPGATSRQRGVSLTSRGASRLAARANDGPKRQGLPAGKGRFFSDGTAGTRFSVDPASDVVFVAMIQRVTNPDNHSLQYRGHATVYQALVDPSK